MRGTWTIVLLILGNAFMTVAWHGHLRSKEHGTLSGVILVPAVWSVFRK